MPTTSHALPASLRVADMAIVATPEMVSGAPTKKEV